MTLQNFQPKARITGDKMDLRNYFGRPLLVRVTEFVPDFTSQSFPTPKPVVFADVVDLASGQIFINVLWGGGAVVDNLKEHAGTDVVLPLMAQNAVGSAGRNYIALTALDDSTAALAGQWYQQNWGVVEQTRQQKMAQAAAAAPAQNQFQQQAPAQQPGQQWTQQAPAGVQAQPPATVGQVAQQGFAQPQGQQGFGGPVPGFQGQPNPQGQFGAPGLAQPAQQQQGFAQPQGQQFQQPAAQPQGQAPAGMFTDQQQPYQGGGFAQPAAGTDPQAAQAALQQLNGQLGG
jgi:hypothetical protein